MAKALDLPVPQDLYAEQVVLGCCMLDEEALLRARARVHEQDFYRVAHQAIWRAIEEAGVHGPVDPVSVGAVLRQWGQLEEVGGGEYLTALLGEVPTTAHVVRYAEIVAETGRLRRLIQIGQDLVAAAYAQTSSSAEIIAEHTRRISELGQDLVGGRGARPVEELAPRIIETLEERLVAPPHMTPQRLGIPTIDRRMGGLGGHTLVVIRGEEKAGKSMMGIQILLSTARQLMQEGDPRCCVAYLLEGEDIWVERAMAWLGDFDAINFVPTVSTGAEEQERFRHAARIFPELPLYLNTHMFDVDEIVNDVERVNMGHPVALVLIDYAQLLRGGRGERELERVEYRANRLATLAADLRAPIVVPSQVTTLQGGERHAKGARAWDEAASFSFDIERGETGNARELRQKSQSGLLRLHGCRRKPPFYQFHVDFNLGTGHITESVMGGE